MDSRGKVRRMFPGGNTAKGFHSFFDYITGDDYTKRYIIKGGPGGGKSTFMSKIGQYMLEHGFDIEEYHCSTDPDSLDALSIPELGVALLDGMVPHTTEPRNPGITDDIIWLGQYWDESKLSESKEEILKLNKRADKLFKIAFSHLKEARVAYDEWRSYVRDDFNKKEYNFALRQVIDDLFRNKPEEHRGQPRHTHFFASAISGKGVYNYTESLIEPTFKVYAFSGMPGSGAKVAIRRIALEAEELGISTQQFHCPVDVEELDMLIIPELNSVVVNMNQILSNESTLFDYNQVEAYVNFGDYLNYGTIYEFNDDIEDAKQRFYNMIDRAIDLISRAKATHGQVEKYYIKAMNFEEVDHKMAEILDKIIRIAKI